MTSRVCLGSWVNLWRWILGEGGCYTKCCHTTMPAQSWNEEEDGDDDDDNDKDGRARLGSRISELGIAGCTKNRR